MKETIGFIGCGNMGQAMARGAQRSGLFRPEHILLTDTNADKARALADELGAVALPDAQAVAEQADYLVLAIKPGVYPAVLENIAGHVKEDAILVIIAVGISFDDLYDKLGDVKAVRVQPSTPALVGASDSTMCPDKNIEPEELKDLKHILSSFGTVEILDAALMDNVPAIASSAPAYAFLLISAMADGGCLVGFPREQAIRLAAQAVYGAAKMVLETGEHPDVLKDKVCTPGGTTIEAVKVLEENGFRSAIIRAVEACAAKSRNMSRRDETARD